jgi:hypothetical protein
MIRVVIAVLLLLPFSFGFSVNAFDLRTNKTRPLALDSSSATVVLFLSTQCVCTDSYWDQMTSLFETYSKFEFVVVFSGTSKNYEDEKNKIVSHLKASNTQFVISQDLIKKVGATKTPMAFVYDSKLNLRYRGGIADASLVGDAKNFYLSDFLRTFEPDLSSSKIKEYPVLGCSID